MSKANDSETGRLRRKSEAMEEKESQSLRQLLISVGLEAESSASRGWRMSAANDSETGRLRRRNEERGAKKNSLVDCFLA